jgi:hypothetical protein
LSSTASPVFLRVSEGKLAKIVQYVDRKRAFADLGLTPDTGT